MTDTWDTTTFVAFDTETTGLAKSDRIIEIGFVLVEDGAVTAEASQLLDPKMPISPGASNIHKIYDDDVGGMPTFEEYLPKICDWLNLGPWVAHNLSFDARMVRQELGRIHIPVRDKFLLDRPTLCTLQAARSRGHQGHAKLGDLARHYNIDQQDAHRACDDARVCALLTLKMMRGIPLRGSQTKLVGQWFR